jgi:hypothetical protein
VLNHALFGLGSPAVAKIGQTVEKTGHIIRLLLVLGKHLLHKGFIGETDQEWLKVLHVLSWDILQG